MIRKLIVALGLVGLGSSAVVPAAAPPARTRTAQHATPFVIAANPLAARAGLNVLKRGGSAVDAAIAVQAMLSLVEPQSSGVGGGAFLNYYDGRTGKITIYDGREVAPAQATPGMFLGPTGKPLPFDAAVVSGRATGVPGAVKMLALAHGEHGKLPWRSLFGDAQRTADQGFTVSPRLERMIHADYAENHQPDVIAYFSRPDGTLLNAGDRLVNKPYAEFLRRLASQGPDALYKGSTAAKIVARTRQGPLAGTMTMTDLAAYKPVKREPVCGPVRIYLLCAPPPPSSGVGLIELMMILDRTDIASRNANDPQAWFLFAEASRLMYADRDRYVGDPAFVHVPVAGLIDPAYVAARARLIGTTAGPPPEPGQPALAPLMAADNSVAHAGTSHFIVRDRDGNVVSMTTTVESIFGSGRMVDGFFLNNQMTDFSFSPEDRQSQPGSEDIDNTQIRLSNGTIIFTPGALAPDTRVDSVKYYMADFDGGVKWRGMELSAEWYLRWLQDFRSDEHLPVHEMFDHCFQVLASAMVLPKTVQVYSMGSYIFGDFGDSWEMTAGINWWVFRRREMRVNFEYLYDHQSPIGYTAVPQQVGGTGGVITANLEMSF